MRILTNRHTRQSPARRRVFGVFAALWVSLVVQPCAIAAVSNADCPHDPAMHEQMDMPAGHHHDAAAQEEPCATAEKSCCDDGAAAIDGRSSEIKFKNGGDVAAIVHSYPVITPARFDAFAGSIVDPPEHFWPSPPLRVLYCVYLK